jgi:hypothetical protein
MSVSTVDRKLSFSATSDDQTMLALAMLSYRVFHDLRPGQLRLSHLRRAIVGGLADLEPVADRFDLVWGPAAYRAPLTVFDQNVMYVVKERAVPRYVVVVRGTNPLSAIDWVFGDLWVGFDTAWPRASDFGFPPARVSLSTHLALNILRHMRSAGPRPTPVQRVWRIVDEQAGDPARRSVRSLLRPFGKPTSFAMRKLRMRIRSDLRELKVLREALGSEDLEERLAGMLAAHASDPARRIAARLRAGSGDEGDRAQRELLRLLEGSFHLRSRLAPGADLTHFLRAAVAEESSGVEVAVAGHSKGGALSSTLALWLAQTQGAEGVRVVHQWDRDSRATVSCWSYAGPTAGNAAFAALSDTMLGDRCHRFSNRLDMVPHAWQVRPGNGNVDGFSLAKVPQLYGKAVHRPTGLVALARAVGRDVGPLGYRHVGGDVAVLDGAVDPAKDLFSEQVAYQHMGAYLDALGMGEYGDTRTFFDLVG